MSTVSRPIRRRQLLAGGALAGGAIAGTALAGAVAKPAIAPANPAIRWRLAFALPGAQDALCGPAAVITAYVREATDGQFRIEGLAARGALDATAHLQALDAVSEGTIEACHAATARYAGRDPTWALFCAVPFGLNTRHQNAWFLEGEGMALMNAFAARSNVRALAAGNAGCQMGGWFRREVREPGDFRGLKFRIGGLAGLTIGKLGGVPQDIADDAIYRALERGSIDAAEGDGPLDDERLGLHKVAPYYYYPGWWSGAAAHHLLVNLAKWNALPRRYQTILAGAAALANGAALARCDARNPAALRGLIAGGARMRAFPPSVLQSCLTASRTVNAEIAAGNADFRTVLASMQAFRDEAYFWWQVAEYGYDAFMIRSRHA